MLFYMFERMVVLFFALFGSDKVNTSRGSITWQHGDNSTTQSINTFENFLGLECYL